MVAGAATGDPPTIHDHIKSSSQYEVYVVVFGSLGDQRLTGGNREGFGAIGQVFGQLTITGDKTLSRESLYEEAPTPSPLNGSNSVIFALVLRRLNHIARRGQGGVWQCRRRSSVFPNAPVRHRRSP